MIHLSIGECEICWGLLVYIEGLQCYSLGRSEVTRVCGGEQREGRISGLCFVEWLRLFE